MWAVAQIEMKKQLHDKSLFFWSLVLPIVFTILFIAIFTSSIPDDQGAVVNQTITGFSVFFSVFIIITMTVSFVKDKDRGFVARLASTPLPPNRYITGKWLPFILIVFIQLITMSLVGMIGYGMTIEHPIYYYLLIFSLAIMMTSWGIAVAVFSKTENMGIVVTQIVALGGAILSGLWMPYEILPDMVQTVGRLLPQYWAHQSLLYSVSGMSNVDGIGLTMMIILGYTAVGFIIAIAGYRRFLRHSKS